MFKRIMIGWVGLMTALGVMAGQELALALKATPAPDQEFIRTPAKYVFKKLSDTAHRSGNPDLSSFSITYELAGCDDVKISINLANRTLLDAIQEAAKATGAGIDFQKRGVVLKDPSLVEELVLAEPKPEPMDEPELEPEPEVEKTSSRKKKVNLKPGFDFSDISGAIVFVENGDGRGSAFIAEMDGKTYVFSNQHNFLGAKRIVMRAMNGKALKPKQFEYSRTHDLVRLRLDLEDMEGLKALKFSTETPAIDDKIVIYGNSAGGGVATELEGEVLGVGPADIEVKADFVLGNSGSPILNVDAEVIGVATYASLGRKFERGSASSKIFKGTRFGKVRRYAVRIPEQGWVNDSMNFYLRQTYRLEDMNNYLTAMIHLYCYWQGDTNYEAMVNQMYSAYGSITESSNPPFDFHMKEMEEQLRKVVRSFKMNHEDLAGGISKSDFYGGEDGASRIRKILSEGVEAIKGSAGKTHWKSQLLSREAEAIEDQADIVLNAIRDAKNPYKKKKGRR